MDGGDASLLGISIRKSNHPTTGIDSRNQAFAIIGWATWRLYGPGIWSYF